MFALATACAPKAAPQPATAREGRGGRRTGAPTANQASLVFRQEGGVATMEREAAPAEAAQPGGSAAGGAVAAGQGATAGTAAAPADASSAMKVTITALPKHFWDVEVTAHDVAIHRGQAYKLTFWAKAATPRVLFVDVSHDGPPYSPVGYANTFPLGTTWKKYETVFTADADPWPVGRVVFKLGQTTETVWLAGFSFRPAEPSEVPVIDEKKVVDGALPPRLEAEVEKTIRDVRQGPFAVTVVDGKGKPVAGAQVHVKLVRHAFLFGQTLPHRDWSKDKMVPWQEKFLALWEPITTLVVPENSTKAVQWNKDPTQAQSIFAFARDHGLAFKSHAPIWGFEYSQWRKGTIWDCAKIKADVEPRLEAQFRAFKGHHTYSDLSNEMVSAPFIQEQCGGEQVLIDWYKRAHELDPDVKLTINDYEQMRGRGTRVDDLVKRFKAAGAPVAAQGEQLHDRYMWYPPEEVWAMLDRMAANGVEVHLTEITQPDDGSLVQGGYVDGVVWNAGNQAAYLKQTYRLAFGHPAVAGIVMWNFWDGSAWLGRGGIVDVNFQPKPAYEALHELITRTWSTDVSLKSSGAGQANGRGFYGTYDITVTKPGGATETFHETLTRGKPTHWRLQLTKG
jgi:GH35 family endo-1,4-beta-xylanase